MPSLLNAFFPLHITKQHASSSVLFLSISRLEMFLAWFFCFSYPSCSGVLAPGLAADMHFISDVIAFVGPACLFALEPVARLAAYWNTPIITGMGDQVMFTSIFPSTKTNYNSFIHYFFSRRQKESSPSHPESWAATILEIKATVP